MEKGPVVAFSLKGYIMETRIKHVAICTENYDRMAEFYKTTFGMKKITNGMTDATGNFSPERGHISDGLIGYALLQRILPSRADSPYGQTLAPAEDSVGPVL